MGTVVGAWRLRLLMILVIFATVMYTINGMFSTLDGNVSDGYITYENTSDYDLSMNDTSAGESQGNSFIDVIGGLGNFLTFGAIDNPWARLFFTTLMTFVGIGIGYIVYTFVKEWIPFT
jgi:hypothetical protein